MYFIHVHYFTAECYNGLCISCPNGFNQCKVVRKRCEEGHPLQNECRVSGQYNYPFFYKLPRPDILEIDPLSSFISVYESNV